MQGEAGEQALRLAVSMALLPIGDDEQFGERFGIVFLVPGADADGVEGIEPVGMFRACRVENVDEAELAAVTLRDGVVLALDIRADDGAAIGEQVGDDNADTLARPHRRENDDHPVLVKAQELAAGPAHDWPAASGDPGKEHLPFRGESRGAHVGAVARAAAPQPSNEPGAQAQPAEHEPQQQNEQADQRHQVKLLTTLCCETSNHRSLSLVLESDVIERG